jgi:hypothetical protein
MYMDMNETTEARATKRRAPLIADRKYLRKVFFENRQNSETINTRATSA